MKTHAVRTGILVLPGTWFVCEKIGEWREDRLRELRTRDALRQLERLQKLRESGAVTEHEFERLKARLTHKI